LPKPEALCPFSLMSFFFWQLFFFPLFFSLIFSFLWMCCGKRWKNTEKNNKTQVEIKNKRFKKVKNHYSKGPKRPGKQGSWFVFFGKQNKKKIMFFFLNRKQENTEVDQKKLSFEFLGKVLKQKAFWWAKRSTKQETLAHLKLIFLIANTVFSRGRKFKSVFPTNNFCVIREKKLGQKHLSEQHYPFCDLENKILFEFLPKKSLLLA